MRSIIETLRLSMIANLVIIAFTSQSSADFFGDVWGVVTDPLKLSKASTELSDSVERTMIQLRSLEGVANSHATERLEQIRSILKDALSGSDELFQKSTKAMRELEKQVNKDAMDLVYNIKCASDVTFMDTAQKSFAGLISTLSKADPSIVILGIKIIDLKTNNVEISYPDQAYISTKAAALSELEKTTSDASPAYDILSVYQNLEIAAKYNRCYYRGQVNETVWAEEANEMERISMPWVSVVQPDINFRSAN